MIVTRDNEDGTAQARLNYWAEDVTIKVKVPRGLKVSAGSSHIIGYEEGNRQLPFVVGRGKSGVESLSGVILTGNGEWVTPESDFLNSYGLTVPMSQLVWRLDGGSPGTITTLATLTRFGSGTPTDLDYVNHTDQLGLLAFTAPVGGGGTSTVLACYATNWANTGNSSGTSGTITERAIQGSTAEIADTTITFGGYLASESRSTANTLQAQDRKQGYFFVDLTVNTRGIYVVLLDSGIYIARRSDNTQARTEWTFDILRPNRSGNVSFCGKFLVEGWAGYDKSQAALDAFNAGMFGADPATSYLYDPQSGYLELIQLPDVAARGVMRIYTRQDDLTYVAHEIDLKGRAPGRTVRKIFGAGLYYRGTRNLYDGAGAPLLDGGGDEILQAARSLYKIVSTRWPWLVVPAKKRTEIWFSVASQIDGATSADPGQGYWQLFSVEATTRAVTLRNQLVTPLNPATPEVYAGIVADSNAIFAAEATASRALTEPLFFMRRVTQFYLGVFQDYFLYSRGYFYDGIDPAATADIWRETDRWIQHPLPGDLTSEDYISGADVAIDAIVPGSSVAPSGAKDLRGNHYEIASEPIHFTDGVTTAQRSDFSSGAVLGDPDFPFDSPYATTVTDDSAGYNTGGTVIIAHRKYGYRSYSQGHKTWLTKTSHDGNTRPKVDITETISYDFGGQDKLQNYPKMLCCWQLVVVGEFLFVLRQCLWELVSGVFTTTGARDRMAREPYLEIYATSTLARLQKISLHPPADTSHTLFPAYDVAPRIGPVGVDINGNAWAQIFTDWLTVADAGSGSRLSLVQHQKTEIRYKTAITRTDHLYQGVKETGIPLPSEACNIAANNSKAYVIDGSAAIKEYVGP